MKGTPPEIREAIRKMNNVDLLTAIAKHAQYMVLSTTQHEAACREAVLILFSRAALKRMRPYKPTNKTKQSPTRKRR